MGFGTRCTGRYHYVYQAVRCTQVVGWTGATREAADRDYTFHECKEMCSAREGCYGFRHKLKEGGGFFCRLMLACRQEEAAGNEAEDWRKESCVADYALSWECGQTHAGKGCSNFAAIAAATWSWPPAQDSAYACQVTEAARSVGRHAALGGGVQTSQPSLGSLRKS